MLNQGHRAAYTVDEFCDAHRLSRAMLYKSWNAGIGPRFLLIGSKRVISFEAAADWRAEREAAASKQHATSTEAA
jgi:hypothetical protein